MHTRKRTDITNCVFAFMWQVSQVHAAYLRKWVLMLVTKRTGWNTSFHSRMLFSVSNTRNSCIKSGPCFLTSTSCGCFLFRKPTTPNMSQHARCVILALSSARDTSPHNPSCSPTHPCHPPLSSTLKICATGEILVEGVCTPLSCTITTTYPIHDKDGRLAKLDSLLDNPEYEKPKNVAVGDCSKFLTEQYYVNKVDSGSTCALVIGRGRKAGVDCGRQRARS